MSSRNLGNALPNLQLPKARITNPNEVESARNWKKTPRKFGKMNVPSWQSTGPRKLKSKEKPKQSNSVKGVKSGVTNDKGEGYVNTPITRSSMRHLPVEDRQVIKKFAYLDDPEALMETPKGRKSRGGR